MSKKVTLLLILVIFSLIVAIPKRESLFDGILITYIGFVFLNGYPFNMKLKIPPVILYLVIVLSVLCIGYGWGTIFYMSQGVPPVVVQIFGIFFLALASVGWTVSIFDWTFRITNTGPRSDSVCSQGMYALVRHPQVSFSIIALIGFDLYYWSAALAWTTPLWIIGFVSYAALEEKLEMLPRFGDEYLKYCDHTPGLLPDKASVSAFFEQYNN